MEIIQGIFLVENLVKSAITAYNKRRDRKGICDGHRYASEPNTGRMQLTERVWKDAACENRSQECRSYESVMKGRKVDTGLVREKSLCGKWSLRWNAPGCWRRDRRSL